MPITSETESAILKRGIRAVFGAERIHPGLTPTQAPAMRAVCEVPAKHQPHPKSFHPSILLLFAMLSTVTYAQSVSVSVFPAEQWIPSGGYQPVTAVVTGAGDSTVTWTSDGGTIYGSNPCTLNEPCAAALYSAGTGILHLTATSNANHAASATTTIHFMASPAPATDHPRFMLNGSTGLAALQAKATSGNATYQNFVTQATSFYGTFNSIWGSGANLSCNGGTGIPSGSYDAIDYPSFIWNLSIMAMMDPSDPSHKWACMGRDVYTYTAAQILTQGVNPWAGNAWAAMGEAFAPTADWLMGANAFNAGTGATATATVTGGAMNTPTLTAGGSGYLPGTTIYWIAFAGSSGCTPFSGNDGKDIVGIGTVNVNSSGVVAGPLTTITNATGCTSAPAIVIENDLGLIREMMYVWLQYTTINPFGNGSTAPIPGTGCTIAGNPTNCYNTSAEFNTGDQFDFTNMRGMGNNYTQTRLLYLVDFALTFNDNTTDDPPLANTCGATRYVVCPDGTAGSLHAYWYFFAGGIGYKTFAALEEGTVAWKVYQAAYGNLPSQPVCSSTWGNSLPCFGVNRGGEAVEGRFYGNSLVNGRSAWIDAYTAGYADPKLYGPQMSMVSADYWDLRTLDDLATNVSIIPSAATAAGGDDAVGAWTYWTTGDSYKYYLYPASFEPEAGNTIWNSLVGRTDMSNAYLWAVYYSAWGGPTGTLYPCTSSCGWNTETQNDFGRIVVPYLVLSQPAWDPLANLPPDPRPSLPLAYYAAANQHLMVRTGWASTDTAFSYYLPNTMVDHEHQFVGRFDISRNGEYITKGVVEFNDYNNSRSQAGFQNMLSVFNSNGSNCSNNNCFIYGTVNNGGPFWHSYQGGLQDLTYSVSSDHIGAITQNAGNSYNGGSTYAGYTDVQSASRSLVYLRNTNQVAWYDRAAVGHAASVQATHLTTTGPVTVAANVASWATRSGTQKAYFTSLLGGTLTSGKLPIYISVSGPFSNLQIGTNMTITCTQHYADASTGPCPPTTQWISNFPSVASVSATGSTAVVTANSLGNTCIQAYNPIDGTPGGNYNCIYGGSPGGSTFVVSGASSGTFDGSSEVDTDAVSDWEPSATVSVTPTGSPLISNFLSVLEWGNSTLTQTPTTLVQSSSGQNFDGALIGSNLVMFMRTVGIPTGTTYPASGATMQYVADLSPNTIYTISGTGAPPSATTDNAGVLAFSATGTGNITVGSGIPPSISAVSGGILSGGVLY